MIGPPFKSRQSADFAFILIHSQAVFVAFKSHASRTQTKQFAIKCFLVANLPGHGSPKKIATTKPN